MYTPVCVPGTGKTALMRNKLQAMDTEAMAFSTINLNSFSDAPSVQTILEQPLERKSGARTAASSHLRGAMGCWCNVGLLQLVGTPKLTRERERG